MQSYKARAKAMARAEEIDIVIVGGGICGLATALALHKKDIRSVVLERSESLRATGAAITIWDNGWRALHQLGVDSKLRSTSINFESEGESRCLKRIDLIQALANELPMGTIRFGCQVLSIHVESSSLSSVLELQDGSLIKAKVLIGCDGVNSVVANFIGLKPTQAFSRSAVKGLTIYPNGHPFTPTLLIMRKDQCTVGRIPINETTVYWFALIRGNQRDVEMSKDSASIKQVALDSTIGFSTNIVEMIKDSELSSLSLTKLRFRAPWNLLRGNFRREAATVAGDAWHVMCPFLGQGGATALEDAVVLARCLSKKISSIDLNENKMILSEEQVREALDEYLKERRLRVLHLSTLTYLRGLLSVEDHSLLVRFIGIVIMVVLSFKHTSYDCGKL